MSDLVVPALGESISEAVIAKWLKKVGEAAAQDEPVVELETDKVSVQLPSPTAGVVTEQRYAEGATVRVGDVIGQIGDAGATKAAPAPAPAPAAAPAPAPTPPPNPPAAVVATVATPPATVSAPPTATTAHAPPTDRPILSREREPSLPAPSPIASTALGGDGGQVPPHVLSPAQRRALREREGQAVAATTVQSIPIGTPASITLPAFPNQPLPPPAPVQAPSPAPAAVSTADEQVVAMSPLRKRIAERLVAAQHTAAILTTFNEVDMTNLLALRAKHQDAFVAKHGIKLGFMSFFAKAVVAALQDFPMLNAEVRGTDIVYKKRYHIGVAVGSGRGLVVPVVRDVDRMGFAEIEKEIAALAGKAKDNKLTLEDLSGGTFTITNGGIYGSMMSTPLLNLPQTGILGMHNVIKRPIAVGDEIRLRPMMYIALSYDHRLVDGREAVQFLVGVKERVETPEKLLFSL